MTIGMESWVMHNQRIIGGGLVGVLVLLGCWLRSSGLYQESLWIDEGFTIMQQRAISSHGYPLLRSGQVELKDPLQPYLMAGLTAVRTVFPFSFRWISVFFGSAAILMLFGLSRRLFGYRVAMVSVFFITFSYWHIAWSRQIRSYTMAAFFMLLALCFFLRFINGNRKKDLYGLGIAVLLLLGSKSGMGILFIASLGLFFLLKRQYFYWLFAAGVSLLLGILFHAKISLLGEHPFSNNLHYYLIGYFIRYFGVLFFIAIVGYALAVRRDMRNRDFHIFTGMLWCISLVFFSFFHAITQGRYLFVLTPLIFLYGAYGIWYGVSRIPVRKRIIAFAMVIALLLLVAIDSVTAKTFLFFPQPRLPLEFYTPQPNFNLAYAFIYKRKTQQCTLLSAYPYLDELYLRNAGYALPISYSGQASEPSLIKTTEYYTNVTRIMTTTQLNAFRQHQPICVLLDTMALGNVPSALIEEITGNGTLLWSDETIPEQAIYLYEL